MSDIGRDPRFPEAAFIHSTAEIYGDVGIGEGSSVWPNVVMRAEAFAVRIGRFTNIQDFVMVHIGEHQPTIIGDYCSITHRCILHGCTIGDNCFIGVGSSIMDGVKIGNNCVVGGHAYVKAGTEVPDNSVVVGVPGRVVRSTDPYVANRINALMYYRNALAYRQGEERAWDGPAFDAWLAEQTARLEAERAAAT